MAQVRHDHFWGGIFFSKSLVLNLNVVKLSGVLFCQPWPLHFQLRLISDSKVFGVHSKTRLAMPAMITNSRVDHAIADKMKSVIDHNRRVVRVAIKALQYLATEMIAIRGHHSNEGKFLNLFKLLAQYEPSDNEHTLDTDVVIDVSEDRVTSWIDHRFIKPLRLLQQLSGFTSLQYVYKILVTLPVTSCSAERAMSRVRIVKNRLRSTMLDDWLSSLLLCLASEKDVLSNLELNDIVNRFADCSDSLRRHLIYA